MTIPFRGMFTSTRAESDEADVARDAKRGKRSRAEIGLIGIVVTTMVIVVALQMDKLPFLTPISSYTTYFDDAGGLVVGDVVTVSGVNVGTVQGISLASTDNGTKAQVEFKMNDDVLMGVDTQAVIKTETVLGRRNLTIVPHGPGRIRPGGSIPNQNTVAPYSLSDALEGATSTLAKTDTDQLNTALESMTNVFVDTPDEVKGAVEGVSRLSKTLADRDNVLRELLSRANSVSKVVGDRSEQIDKLLVDANALLGELNMRRQAISALITGTRDVSAQISGFIDDNNAQLTPVLTKLDGVLDILLDNESDLKEAIDGLGPYANLLGEAVASGPYFSSLVGVPSFGDYTQMFFEALGRKYPQLLTTLRGSGNPILPDSWSISPHPPNPAPIPDSLTTNPKPSTTAPNAPSPTLPTDTSGAPTPGTDPITDGGR